MASLPLEHNPMVSNYNSHIQTSAKLIRDNKNIYMLHLKTCKVHVLQLKIWFLCNNEKQEKWDSFYRQTNNAQRKMCANIMCRLQNNDTYKEKIVHTTLR